MRGTSLTPIEPGDVGAVIRLANRIGRCATLPPDPAIDRDDMAQEAILAALCALPKWRPEGGASLQSWVFQYAQWATIKTRKQFDPRYHHENHRFREDEPARERPLSLSWMPHDWDLPDPGSGVRVIEEALLYTALSTLDPEIRRMVWAVVGEGWTLEETAARFGLHREALRRRIKRGLKQMRLFLGDTP